jgi:hypothetical protein
MPWVLGATRVNLGLYILVSLWFMVAWVIVIIYAIKAFKARNSTSCSSTKYLIGIAMIIISYIIVWVGLFNGYMVTV